MILQIGKNLNSAGNNLVLCRVPCVLRKAQSSKLIAQNAKRRVNSKKVSVPFLKKGFTFLELLIVLLVVGLLTAASVPAFKTFAENMRLKAGARLTLNLLRQARSDAIANHRTTCLVVAPDSGDWPDIDLKAMKIVYLEAILEGPVYVYVTLSNWEYLPKGLQINSNLSVSTILQNTINVPYPNEDGTSRSMGAAKFKPTGGAVAQGTIRIELADDTSKFKDVSYLISGRAKIQ